MKQDYTNSDLTYKYWVLEKENKLLKTMLKQMEKRIDRLEYLWYKGTDKGKL
jgi:hypothetical protein